MDPRMGAVDAVMFGVEDDPVLRSVIVMVAELDGPPDEERLLFRVDRMTRMVPQLRQRAIGNPFSIAPPRWETDPNFDLDYHIHNQLLPKKAAKHADLMAALAHWAEQDFDRARPLWEMLIITGLASGGSAVAIKIHHSITDGVGGLQLAAAMLDMSADAGDPTDMPEGPTGDVADLADRIEQGTAYGVQSLLNDGVGAVRKARKRRPS